MTSQSGSIVRLHNGATHIVMVIEDRSFLVVGGWLRPIQEAEVLENPAMCPSCGASRWYWEASLVPKCRDCEPLSDAWQGALLGHAMASLCNESLDEEFVSHARTVLQRDFETWDLERLVTCAGAHALRKGLRAQLNGTRQ